MAYRLAPGARDDLDAIWDHVARETRDEGPADRLIEAIAERLWLLAEHPSIGRVRDDLAVGLRSFPVGRFVIVYEIAGGDVSVLRVLHGRQDLGALFGG
jgi:toxin ParE1/3/4